MQLKPIPMIKNTLVNVLIIMSLASCDSNKKPIKGLSVKEASIFLKSTLNAEFGNQEEGIKKWGGDLKVFLKNPEQEELVKEFEKISNEINELSTSIIVRRVHDESMANFLIFFSDQNTYTNYEPASKDYLKSNKGFFWLYWDSSLTITKGSMYVDMIRATDITCQKHLLREELTQSLGIMNDHGGSKKSIFYKRWTCTTSYSNLDEKIIKLFLDRKVKAGMNYSELINSLSE